MKITRQKITKHYKNFFGLNDLLIGEDDHLMIDWAESLIEDLMKNENT